MTITIPATDLEGIKLNGIVTGRTAHITAGALCFY